ncbi:hypothetical protein IAU60_002586 [Kwoniella sp. DSM 27419]
MPRRNPVPIAVAPIQNLVPPPAPSPIVQALRKDWRWAAISQFVWTFSDAFGLIDWDIENLERDFDGDEQAVIPTLIAKLLFALTYNRQINRENAFENLRKQYAKRHPEVKCALGTAEEPVEWATLGLGQKVEVLHQLCEWQLDDPARFRGLLKSEEDAVSWRVEPIGWDRTGNTYWLFDDNRLWIQRLPPPPPRPIKKSVQKAKKGSKKSRPSTAAITSNSAPRKSHKKKEITPDLTPSPPPQHLEEPLGSSRRRKPVAFYGNPTSTHQALQRGNTSTPANQPGTSSRPTRSSARAAGINPPADTPSKSGKPQSTPLPLGTRVSRRLRNVDDDWQQIPDEWLTPSRAENKGKGKKKQIKGDDESELSELTDEEEHERILRASGGALAVPLPSQAEDSATLVEEPMDGDVDMKSSSDAGAGKIDDGTEGEGHQVNGKPDGDEEQTVEKSAKAEVLEPKPPADLATGEANGRSEEAHAETKVETGLGAAEVTTQNDSAVMDVDVEEEKAVDSTGQADAEAESKEDTSHIPADFVEWEAICVTLYDWRTFPEQFAKTKDLDERALYAMLTEEVGPTIIEVLVAKEQERIKQELVNNRKRSSRIATKELEKEEAMRHEAAQREMEERMERARNEETRQAREEAEAIAREKAREDRLREREERAAAREEAIMRKAEEEVRDREKRERRREKRKRRREGEEVSDDSEDEDGIATKRGSTAPIGNGTATPQERWELKCEVCLKQGWNLDEDDDLVCCDDCGRWQHVDCHNRRDVREGRGKRNWDQEDFRCKECLLRAERKRQRLEAPASGLLTPTHPGTNGHSSSSPTTSHPMVSGSAPGPSPPVNPARPPPPPPQQGEYYLPYPHPPARQDRPAGYAVYYPPGQSPSHSRPGQAHVSHVPIDASRPTETISTSQNERQLPPLTSPHGQYAPTSVSHTSHVNGQYGGAPPDSRSPAQPPVDRRMSGQSGSLPSLNMAQYPPRSVPPQLAPQGLPPPHAYAQPMQAHSVGTGFAPRSAPLPYPPQEAPRYVPAPAPSSTGQGYYRPS